MVRSVRASSICQPATGRGRKGLSQPLGRRSPWLYGSCSWLNLVECFFSIITRQAIRRGSFASVSELTTAIGAFIDGWNDHPRPFTWTKDADQILAPIQSGRQRGTGSADPAVG
jgi:hypothetical protein